jgi:hypothetical protein
MSRKRLLLVVAPASVAAALLLVWLLLPRGLKGKYGQIRLGMTMAEAEAIIGCQPGEHWTDGPNY